ncbi:MAG: TonB-dependent receptor [Pseudomonadota bacterium]
MFYPPQKRTIISLSVASACCLLALPAGAQVAEAAPAPATGEVIQVTVTGFRSSLEKALNLKRAAITTRESIVAEDIGKFPEQNIADSLIRLPGVEVVKEGNSNEGQRIQLRGLSSEYTVTTFNGAPVRATSAGNVGASTRDFNYDVFASELFGRVDVYKAPLAELEEGGVAGVVDLQTPRPFDKKGKVIRYSAAAARNAQSGYVSPRAHILLSNTWGNVGFLASIATNKARNANAGYHTTGIYNNTKERLIPNASNFQYNLGDPRASLGSVTQAQLEEGQLPRFFRIAGQDNIRERVGFSTSLQYKTGALDLSWDTLYSKLQDDVKTNYFNFMTRGATGALALVPMGLRIDGNDQLQGKLGNLTMATNALAAKSETEFKYNAINGKYKVTDKLKLSGQISASNSVAWRNQTTITAEGLDAASRHEVSFDTTDALFPSISSNRNLLDPKIYTSFSGQGFDRSETDKQRTFKLVGDYDWGFGDVEARLKVGVGSVKSTKLARAQVASNLLGSQMIPGVGLYSAASAEQRKAFMQGLLVPNDLKNFAPDAGNGYPRDWLTFDRNYVYGSINALGQYTNVPQDLGGTFDAVETVNSLFVQSDFDTKLLGRGLRANAGVRYVQTQTAIDNYFLLNGAYTPVSKVSKYHNALPSFSAAYDLGEDLVWRASWGKTLTRSSISLLARAYQVPSQGDLIVNQGNPELKPELSRNLDTGLEWYFSKGSILALNGFQKEISGRAAPISTYVPFNTLGLAKELWFTNIQALVVGNPLEPVEVRKYQNAEAYKVRGTELAYQQTFKFLPAPFNNMGAIGSYTKIKTAGINRTYNGKSYELPIVPGNTYAFTLYYENGPLSLRTSYNHKSEFANVNSTGANTLGLQRWYNARGSLDMSASYKFNDKLELRLDATNMGDSKTYEFLRHFEGKHGNEHSRIDTGYMAGRVLALSVRGKL